MMKTISSTLKMNTNKKSKSMEEKRQGSALSRQIAANLAACT